jgi:general secretion pathway protein I
MNARGFTLVEVLVALSVVAIGLLALVSTSGYYARQSADLRDRAYAGWVASNQLAALRIEPGFPEPGTETGESTLGGVRWSWRVVVSPAPGEQDLRRIDVTVAHAATPDDTVVVLTGFIGRHRPVTTGVQP